MTYCAYRNKRKIFKMKSMNDSNKDYEKMHLQIFTTSYYLQVSSRYFFGCMYGYDIHAPAINNFNF